MWGGGTERVEMCKMVVWKNGFLHLKLEVGLNLWKEAVLFFEEAT